MPGNSHKKIWDTTLLRLDHVKIKNCYGQKMLGNKLFNCNLDTKHDRAISNKRWRQPKETAVQKYVELALSTKGSFWSTHAYLQQLLNGKQKSLKNDYIP